MPPAWTLPLIVLGIAVPISVGFLIAGPGLGLAVGALAGAALLVTVARMRPDRSFEIAPSADERHRVLVIALAAIEDPETAAGVAAATGPGGEALVLAPAQNRALDHWADDIAGAREEAQRRLALSLGTLAAAGVDARGRVGDADPVQAVEDALHEFAADEAVLVAPPVERRGSGARTLAGLRAHLDVPLRLVETGAQ